MLLFALHAAFADEAARSAKLQEPATVGDIHFEESMRDARWDCRVLWPTLCRAYRGTGDNRIRAVMEQEEDGFGAHLPGTRRLVERPVLQPETLAADAWRVELWYAHHGWFDAQVVGWEVVETEPRGRFAEWWPRWGYSIPQAPVVDLTAHVEEGPRSFIRSVTVTGAEAAGPAMGRKLDRRAEELRDAPYINSAPYSLAFFVESELRDVGYARVRTDVRMLARPEDQAVDVFVTVEPGDICVFGEVEIVGNVAVSKEDIQKRVTIKPGGRYDPSAMQETQRNLFSLGVFAVVQVIPDLETPGQQIAVRIEVTEARFREIKVGGGAATALTQGEVRGRVAILHKNLFNRLIRVDVDATAGQRVYTDGSLPTTALQSLQDRDLGAASGSIYAGPFAQVYADLVWPDLFGVSGLSHTPETRYELSFQQLQTYHDVALAPAFTWQPSRTLSFTPTYRWEFRAFTRRDEALFSPTLDEVERSLDSWAIQSVQLRVNYNTARPLFQPTHGWSVQASVLNAGGFLPGFTWAQGDLDVRKYQALAVGDWRAVLAFRAAGGYQRAYGDQGHVPSWKRYKLGGSNDVRGYAEDNLGPRVCFQRDPKTGLPSKQADGGAPVPQTCNSLQRQERVAYPLGGTLSLFGSVELRMDWVYGSQLVLFHDLGQVWPEPEFWSLRELSPTAGLGFRYPTPAGPARLDLGFRYLHYTDLEVAYSEDRFFGIYFALGEAF